MGVVPLFSHQQTGLDFLKDKPAAAIYAGLGTGKTRIILEDAARLDLPLYVFCPKSAIPVWEREIVKWGFDRGFWAVNYEKVWREPWYKRLETKLRASPHMLVLDESHRIKDRTTKQSRAARRLARFASFRRVLTGTPVVNGYHDLWAQMDFLNPTILGKWGAFSDEHLLFDMFFPSKVVGVKNVAALQAKVAPYVFSVKAEDVLDLPAETDLYREFELPAKARKAYDDMEQDLYAELEGFEIEAPNALVKILRLAQITGGFLTRDGTTEKLHEGKLALLDETIESLDGEKFVIFCRFRAELAEISRLLERRGIAYKQISGDTTLLARGLFLDGFHAGKLQAMVLQIQAGSASIDLIPARYAIYYSVGWAFGDYEQSRGRIRRYGQTRPQFYLHLQARDTIDAVIDQALARKEGIHEAVRSWWRRREER